MDHDSGMKRENRKASNIADRQPEPKAPRKRLSRIRQKPKSRLRNIRSQGQRVGGEIILPRVRCTLQHKQVKRYAELRCNGAEARIKSRAITKLKYSCIRCLKDDRIGDGQVMQIDQCLSCSRYEPIVGRFFIILFFY